VLWSSLASTLNIGSRTQFIKGARTGFEDHAGRTIAQWWRVYWTVHSPSSTLGRLSGLILGRQSVKDKETIQAYVNNFRRHLAPYLKPNVGVAVNVFSSDSGGGILEFMIGEGVPNDDVFKPTEPTVNDALHKIEQRAFGGNLNGFRFAGTNVVMEGNRIILIKGEDDPTGWNDEAARDDVMRVVAPSEKTRK